MKDKRHPELCKVGCYYAGEKKGFVFFSNDIIIKDGDVFIYNKGILWGKKDETTS